MPRPPPPDPSKLPLAYFITFHTYGTRLHGAEDGSVDRDHNEFATPPLARDEAREQRERELMTETALVLTHTQRVLVDQTVREVAAHRGWEVFALAARSTHVHVVIAASVHPDRVMNDFKAWVTRRLKERGGLAGRDRIWSRHGSTRWLYDESGLEGAIEYVLNWQDLSGSRGSG